MEVGGKRPGMPGGPGSLQPAAGLKMGYGTGNLVPEIDKYIARFFPGIPIKSFRSKVRSVRFSSPGASGGTASQNISFQFGGLIYEVNGSTTGAGINSSRNTPGNQTWELQMTFPGDVPIWDGYARADALFGETCDRHRFFIPPIYVDKGTPVTVSITNQLSSAPTLINVLLFTIEPIAKG